MRKLLLALASATMLTTAAGAATVYPIDRATILVNSPFDFKVEFDKVVKPEDVKVTVNGQDYEAVFGSKAEFTAEEKGAEDKVLGSALILRGLKIGKAGDYKVEVSAGDETKSVNWDVYATGNEAKAKNIIFLIADGLSVAHRTGARIMSKGMTEGKANGRLNMDDIPPVAFIGTSSTHSIATDSANTMSAYMTGHKSRVNALGVYADRTPDSRTTRRLKPLQKQCVVKPRSPSALFRHPNFRTRHQPRWSHIRASVPTRLILSA